GIGGSCGRPVPFSVDLCERVMARPPELASPHAIQVYPNTSTAWRSTRSRCALSGFQPRIASMTKKPITKASATCQPCLSHRPTDLASGYMLASATPAEDPNQIIEPPNPTA